MSGVSGKANRRNWGPLTEAQQALAAEHAGRVPAISTILARKFPHLDRDVLASAVHEGLIRAAATYDPRAGTRFQSWVDSCAWSQASDANRRAARHRKRLRTLQLSCLVCRGDASDNREAPGEWATLTDPPARPTDAPDSRISEDEFWSSGRILRGLPSRTRAVLRMYCDERLLQADIAERLGMSPSNVSLILTKAARWIAARQEAA